MGSQQSCQTMPNNPLITKLLHSLYFIPMSTNPTQTICLSHRYFSNQFTRIQKSKFDRSMNPFCPVRIQNTDNWQTCCIVSPLMAIISPVAQLNTKTEKLDKQLKILPVYQRLESQIEIVEYISLDKDVGLIVFQQPYWKVGWAGISYIQNQQQLYKFDIKSVCHPERIFPKQEGKKVFYNQQVGRLKVPKTAKLREDFIMQLNGTQGAIICKIADKKPYIIGVQITTNQIKFFDKKLFDHLHKRSKQHIKKRGGQRQVLKLIDIEAFQIQTEL